MSQTTSSSRELPHFNARRRLKGRVQWFNAQRGFGYIKPDDLELQRALNGKDLFVHFKFIVQRGFKSLAEGDAVEFYVGKNHEGPVAMDVKRISEETA